MQLKNVYIMLLNQTLCCWVDTRDLKDSNRRYNCN